MNIYLAPFQGITMAHYRALHGQLFDGVDAYYAPFITTTNERMSSRRLFKDVFPKNNQGPVRVVPQLLSCNGDDFRYFAKIINDMGYEEINWNIGCPFPMVAKKKRGSGILPFPDLIRSVLDEACKDTGYDLTVKMRLGYKSLDEGLPVIEALNDYPLKGVMIHGRTGAQMYTGQVNLEAFDVLYKACKHTLTYNGDIYSLEDYESIQNRYPDINNIMLGRGLLRDPFLARMIKGGQVSPKERLEKMKAFHNGLYREHEKNFPLQNKLCGVMKEFWHYSIGSIDPSRKHFESIKRTSKKKDYLEAVEALFNDYAKNVVD